MKQISMNLSELGLVMGSRALTGAGVALLVAERLPPQRRKAVGMALLTVGVLTAIPLLANIFGKTYRETPPQD